MSWENRELQIIRSGLAVYEGTDICSRSWTLIKNTKRIKKLFRSQSFPCWKGERFRRNERDAQGRVWRKNAWRRAGGMRSKSFFSSQDPNDSKTGTQRSAQAQAAMRLLFAAEIYRVYVCEICESLRWKNRDEMSLMNVESAVLKRSLLWSRETALIPDWNMKAVHRVQRVPETESGGRIHTSTCNGGHHARGGGDWFPPGYERL